MFRVARVAGIPVRVDVSWFLVFALISWSLAAGYFPHVLPGLSPGAAWLQGMTASALLFLSVLAHELSHALVARRHGVRVNGIRLHVFGGVSELTAEPPSPRACCSACSSIRPLARAPSVPAFASVWSGGWWPTS
jgi:Zn-dependent protease